MSFFVFCCLVFSVLVFSCFFNDFLVIFSLRVGSCTHGFTQQVVSKKTWIPACAGMTQQAAKQSR